MDSNRRLLVVNNLSNENKSPLMFDTNLELQDQHVPQLPVSLNFDMNDEFEPRAYFNKIDANSSMS